MFDYNEEATYDFLETLADLVEDAKHKKVHPLHVSAITGVYCALFDSMSAGQHDGLMAYVDLARQYIAKEKPND